MMELARKAVLACTLASWVPVAYAIQVSTSMSADQVKAAVLASVQAGESCEDIVKGMLAAGLASGAIVEEVLDGSQGACDVTTVIVGVLTKRPGDAFEVVAAAYYLLGDSAKERIRVAANSVAGVDQEQVEEALDNPYQKRVHPVIDPGAVTPVSPS
jgi:hypothetical protein